MIDTCYPLDIWNIGAGLGSECLCDQLPVVSLGTKSLLSFPDGQYFTCIVTFVTGGIRSRWFHWESTVGACASGLHPCLFFLAWFCLCSFGVIKLWVQLYVESHESFVEPEGGLRDPWYNGVLSLLFWCFSALQTSSFVLIIQTYLILFNDLIDILC